MRTLFADTFYWVALTNPQDQWHQQVLAVSRTLQGVRLVTTEEVLTEYLNFLAPRGSHLRRRAGEAVRRMMNNPNVVVIPQAHDTFQTGLSFYEQRPDKEYSLTDCISMLTMRRLGIYEVLTHDHHFAQEGFAVLL
jgi:predicted nucleic acid-binding protein